MKLEIKQRVAALRKFMQGMVYKHLYSPPPILIIVSMLPRIGKPANG